MAPASRVTRRDFLTGCRVEGVRWGCPGKCRCLEPHLSLWGCNPPPSAPVPTRWEEPQSGQSVWESCRPFKPVNVAVTHLILDTGKGRGTFLPCRTKRQPVRLVCTTVLRQYSISAKSSVCCVWGQMATLTLSDLFRCFCVLEIFLALLQRQNGQIIAQGPRKVRKVSLWMLLIALFHSPLCCLVTVCFLDQNSQLSG